MKFSRVYIIGSGVFGWLLHDRISKFYPAEIVMFDKGDRLYFAKATAEEPTLIIVAVPIGEIPSVLREIVALKPEHTFLTEIGSVKDNLCTKYNRIIGGALPFLSTHPMTGPLDTLWGEKDWKRKCLIIDSDSNEYELQDRLSIVTFWEDLGFVIRYISAKDHDRVIGTLSHLSHFMILAYVEFVKETLTPEEIDLAGTSFEKFNAMAKGAERLKDIYVSNEQLGGLVEGFAAGMHLTYGKIKE